MLPKSAKAKGRIWQKQVACAIGDLLDLPVGYDEVVAPREMGQKGVDVKLTGEAFDRFPYDVECKHCEQWAVPTWIKQAQNNTRQGRRWLLFLKRKHTPPTVVLEMEHFFELLRRAYIPADSGRFDGRLPMLDHQKPKARPSQDD
jgi:hypothetical protein